MSVESILNHLQDYYSRLVQPVIKKTHRQLSRWVKTLFTCVLTGYQALLEYIKNKQPAIRQKLTHYAVLCRIDKPIGILLLLWPTLWALWLAAEGLPKLHVLFIFVTGVVLTRSAGCVMNDIADRKVDGHVARTQNRPLVTGLVSVREAFMLASGLMLLAFILVLFTNALTVKLSFIALLLAIIYPFMKRYTYLPQFVLGLAFGWSIPMAFAAETGTVPMIAWLLLLANVLWSVAYDTMYAMVDREDDIRIGVKSTAILFDDADKLIIGVIQLMFLTVFFLLGSQLELGLSYYTGIMIALSLVAYQQYLIKDREPARCFQAFLNNNWLGAAVFLGIFFHYQF